LFTPFDTNEEIREATDIRFEALRGVRVGGIKDRGGVVACAYVGKLLVEAINLLLPLASHAGLLIAGGLEGGLKEGLFALQSLDPFDPGLGRLFTQEGTVLDFKVDPVGDQLLVARAGRDGLFFVSQYGDEVVIESESWAEWKGGRGSGRSGGVVWGGSGRARWHCNGRVFADVDIDGDVSGSGGSGRGH
jgi:hypothetical protein